MGYLDSKYMAKQYLKARQYDKRQETNIEISQRTALTNNQNMQALLKFNHDSNKTRLDNYYSAQITGLNTQLQQATTNNDQTLINELTTQIENAKKELELAQKQLEAQFNDTNNRIQDELQKQDAYFETQKEIWDSNYKEDDGLYKQAKQDMAEALKRLYPSSQSQG